MVAAPVMSSGLPVGCDSPMPPMPACSARIDLGSLFPAGGNGVPAACANGGGCCIDCGGTGIGGCSSGGGVCKIDASDMLALAGGTKLGASGNGVPAACAKGGALDAAEGRGSTGLPGW